MSYSEQSAPRAKRVNVTMPPELHERSLDLVKAYYFGDFSNLIQHLLRRAIFDPSTLLSISPAASALTPESKLNALKELQDSVGLTPEKAAAWKDDVRNARR
jgi:Arc/MetJ-type ribon-helix-helix transcriptional regulator